MLHIITPQCVSSVQNKLHILHTSLWSKIYIQRSIHLIYLYISDDVVCMAYIIRTPFQFSINCAIVFFFEEDLFIFIFISYIRTVFLNGPYVICMMLHIHRSRRGKKPQQLNRRDVLEYTIYFLFEIGAVPVQQLLLHYIFLLHCLMLCQLLFINKLFIWMEMSLMRIY